MSETYTLAQIERVLRAVLSTKTHPELVSLIVEDTIQELRNPRLGVVAVDIERDEQGNIKSVTLPGEGWK